LDTRLRSKLPPPILPFTHAHTCTLHTCTLHTCTLHTYTLHTCTGLSFEGVDPPQLVKQQMLSTFAEHKRVRDKVTLSLSSRMRDKLLSHLLVLALILSDFTVECATLQHDLGLTATK